MNINNDYIKEYEQLIKTTNLQKGYQEFVKFFKILKKLVQNEMKDYIFTNNIIENNMDYSYFQFTNSYFQEKNIKFVIVYIHKLCSYQIWLSGINRKVQNYYYNKIKNLPVKYELTSNPNNLDYILKNNLITSPNYNDIEKIISYITVDVKIFIDNVIKLI